MVLNSIEDTQMIVSPPTAFPIPAQVSVQLQLQGFSYKIPIPFTFVSYDPSSECYLGCSSNLGYGNCYNGKELNSQNQLVSIKACNCTRIGYSGLGCTAQIAISSFTPRSSPNIGGTLVTLTMAGMDNYVIESHIEKYPQDVLGRFGALLTPVTLRAPSVWLCQTPPLDYNGSLSIIFSIDGGETWFENSYELFYYYTLPSLFQVVPSVGPTSGGTVVTLSTSFNHTFVGPPFLSYSCYNDDFATISMNRTIFDTADDPITFRGLNTLCPYEVATYQHNNVKCLFEGDNTSITVSGSIVDVDKVTCVTPPWPGQGPISVSTALDGQTWSSQEIIEGMKSPLQYFFYSEPRIHAIFPNLGPYTETTAITLYGSNLNPRVNLSNVSCQFEASAGNADPLTLRQPRRTWSAMAVFIRDDNSVVCVCPKFSSVLAEVQQTNQVSAYLRSNWTCEVTKSLYRHVQL